MASPREQFLERFARALFHTPHSGFVLKGGTALRALFGPVRLTKDVDLDFTGVHRSAEALFGSVRRAIDTAARGLALTDLTVSSPGKAEMSPRFKVNFVASDGTRHHVEIEVSRDAKRAPPGTVVQQAFVPDAALGIARFWVDMYDPPTLVATKLAALLGREVPRDVYDIDLLRSRALKVDPKLIAWAVSRAGGPSEPARVLWAHLDALSYARCEAELLPALDPTVARRLDETEWTSMKLKVGEYAQTLLEAHP